MSKPPRSQFIEKLHGLLEHPLDPDSLRWVSENAFEISIDDGRARNALSPAFEFRSLSSFIRQLSYYNFKRLSDRRRSSERRTSAAEYIVFSHPSGFFVRGDTSRLNSITRKTRTRPDKGTKRRTSVSSGTGGSDEREQALGRGADPWSPGPSRLGYQEASTFSAFLPPVINAPRPLHHHASVPSFHSTIEAPGGADAAMQEGRRYPPYSAPIIPSSLVGDPDWDSQWSSGRPGEQGPAHGGPPPLLRRASDYAPAQQPSYRPMELLAASRQRSSELLGSLRGQALGWAPPQDRSSHSVSPSADPAHLYPVTTAGATYVPPPTQHAQPRDGYFHPHLTSRPHIEPAGLTAPVGDFRPAYYQAPERRGPAQYSAGLALEMERPGSPSQWSNISSGDSPAATLDALSPTSTTGSGIAADKQHPSPMVDTQPLPTPAPYYASGYVPHGSVYEPPARTDQPTGGPYYHYPHRAQPLSSITQQLHPAGPPTSEPWRQHRQ